MWALAGNELPEMTICFSPVLVTLHASKHKAPADLSPQGSPASSPASASPAGWLDPAPRLENLNLCCWQGLRASLL